MFYSHSFIYYFYVSRCAPLSIVLKVDIQVNRILCITSNDTLFRTGQNDFSHSACTKEKKELTSKHISAFLSVIVHFCNFIHRTLSEPKKS